MQPLPTGITGFDSPEEGVSVERFRSACQAAVRQAYGKLTQVRAAHEHATTNFHEALVSLHDGKETVRVLCNAYFPIIAFTSPATREGDVRLRFLDCPELARSLSSEFTVLSAQDAGAGVSPQVISQLGETELAQLKYWKPQRIGDVVFNYWD